MDKFRILYAVIGLLAGCIIGFAFANSVNRKESDGLRAEVARLRAGGSGNGAAQQQKPPAAPGADAASAEPTLTEAEVREAIATADRKPDDIKLQRNLGLYLYQWASYTRDARYLPDVLRFLKRAYDADPKDHDLMVSLGNVLFDMGQGQDTTAFRQARVYYQKALELKPDDANVRTDLGLTYYFDKPSDPQRAIVEYRKALGVDARHEVALLHLATALIATGDRIEAQQRIDELNAINPSNPALSNLRAQLAQSRNAAGE